MSCKVGERLHRVCCIANRQSKSCYYSRKVRYFRVDAAYCCITLNNALLSESDFLLSELGCVLLRNIQSVKLVQLLLFNGLDFATLFVDLLADLPSLLEIVKAVLLGLLVVGLDLRAELVRMLLKNFFLFLLNSSLLFLNFLLFLNDSEELITLLLCLLGEALLTFKELSLTGVLKISQDFLLVLKVASLLFTSLALPFFKGTLCSESVNLCLSICSFLLEFSESCNFSLLLFFNTLDFSLLFFFSENFLTVVFNNLLFEVFFFLLTLILYINSTLVGFFDLSHHTDSTLFLSVEDFGLFNFNLLGLSNHLKHFTFTHFLILNAVKLTLLNLINDHKGALLLCFLALHLTLFLELEGLQTFNLHHQVKSLLLLDPLLLKAFGLLKLFVSNCHDLGVEHHLIHVLDIIVVLIEHLLSFSEKPISLFLVNNLLLRGRHLVGAFLVKVKHFLLSGFGSSHSGLFLFL